MVQHFALIAAMVAIGALFHASGWASRTIVTGAK